MTIRSVCVFCGAGTGLKAAYADAARATGRALGERGWRLVYGGASVGLMGVLAEGALEAGVEVVGVMPRMMVDREIAHTGLAELRIVETMHQRKAEMAELADAFVALPGGLGTLEELFETWTWGQLGLHQKAFGIVNVAGYYDPLVRMVRQMVSEGFIRPDQVDRLKTAPDPEAILAWLDQHAGDRAAVADDPARSIFSISGTRTRHSRKTTRHGDLGRASEGPWQTETATRKQSSGTRFSNRMSWTRVGSPRRRAPTRRSA